MFKFHVARLTDGQQVFQCVRFKRTGKQAIRFDMMNSQVLAFLFLRFTTDLTGVMITFACYFALLFPRWPAPQLPVSIGSIDIPVMLRWVFLIILLRLLSKFLPGFLCMRYSPPCGVSSHSLYGCLADPRACFPGVHITGFHIEHLSTVDTVQGNFRILHFHRAIIRTKTSIFSRLNSFKWFAAYLTHFRDASGFVQAKAFCRTKTMIFEGLNHFKRFVAMLTYFCDAICFVLRRTYFRAEAARLFLCCIDCKRLPTLFTWLYNTVHHALCIALMRTETAISTGGSCFKRLPTLFTHLDYMRLLHVYNIS